MKQAGGTGGGEVRRLPCRPSRQGTLRPPPRKRAGRQAAGVPFQPQEPGGKQGGDLVGSLVGGQLAGVVVNHGRSGCAASGSARRLRRDRHDGLPRRSVSEAGPSLRDRRAAGSSGNHVPATPLPRALAGSDLLDLSTSRGGVLPFTTYRRRVRNAGFRVPDNRNSKTRH